VIACRVFPNGTGAPTYYGDHEIASVTRDGTGVYSITLQSPHWRLIAAHATVHCGTDVGFTNITETNFGTATPPVLEVTRYSIAGAAADDTASGLTKFISVTAVVEDGEVA
jgi:hypothetical protein